MTQVRGGDSLPPGDRAEGAGHPHPGGLCDLRDQGAVHRHAPGRGRGRQRPGNHQTQPGGHLVVSSEGLHIALLV